MLAQKFLSIALLGADWVLWLLLALSIISISLIIERFLVIAAARRKGNPSSTSVVVCAAASAHGVGALEDALVREKLRLEKRLWLIATIGANAPFVGLFGTVIGIIVAFHELAANVSGGPEIVMAGISDALVATAVGLFVAIPAVVAYNAFVRLIRSTLVAAEADGKAALPLRKAA